jgi:hypothetical protein
VGYYERKRHKPWFDEGCSELLDQRKEAKFLWSQHPSKINEDNLNNVRREAGRAIPGSVVRVPGPGTVPLSADSRDMARELLDAPQKRGVVGWLATAHGRRRRDCLGDADRGVQLNLRLVGESGLYVGGQPAGPDAAQEVVRCLRNWDGLRSPISSSVRS